MTQENSNETEIGNQPKKHSYGKYLLVFVLLIGIFSVFKENIEPRSLSGPLSSFIFLFVQPVLDIGLVYFLVLWIADLIRRRKGVERPENKKIKLWINIIFGILLILFVALFVISLFESSSTELTPEQAIFQNQLLDKNQEIDSFNNEIRAASQSLVNVLNNQEWQKMPSTLQNLLNAAQALQPRLDEYKVFIQQNSDLLKSDQEKTASSFSIKMLDIRDRHNRKLIEIAKLGLTIDWSNPDETKGNQLMVLINELSKIEKEMQDARAGL